MANDEGLFSNFLMFNGDFDQSLFVCLFVFALSNMLSAFLINFSSLLGFRRWDPLLYDMKITISYESDIQWCLNTYSIERHLCFQSWGGENFKMWKYNYLDDIGRYFTSPLGPSTILEKGN